MSLIIKGIDLPKVNEIRMIAITQSGVVFFTTVKDGETSKSGKAEAIPIPTPHGRLIDADELVKQLRKDPLFDLVERYGVSGVIESRPTILETDE